MQLLEELSWCFVLFWVENCGQAYRRNEVASSRKEGQLCYTMSGILLSLIALLMDSVFTFFGLKAKIPRQWSGDRVCV